jgi:hypothetical protein
MKIRIFRYSFTTWGTKNTLYALVYYFASYVKCELSTFRELFYILRKTLLSRFSWKLLALYAWKFISNETLISWIHSVFVLRVRWSLRELLPFKFYDFKTCKLFVIERRNHLKCDWWPLILKISQDQRSRSSKV